MILTHVYTALYIIDGYAHILLYMFIYRIAGSIGLQGHLFSVNNIACNKVCSISREYYY